MLAEFGKLLAKKLTVLFVEVKTVFRPTDLTHGKRADAGTKKGLPVRTALIKSSCKSYQASSAGASSGREYLFSTVTFSS